MKYKVSVIVPVHNSSKYLKKCIDSLINQDYENIEIIAIENGSADDSLNILNNYKNIIVESIEKANIGNARNKGLEIATGKYVCFVDSDDYVEKEYISDLVKGIKDSDMCICNYTEIHEETHAHIIKKDFEFETLNIKDIKDNLDRFNYGPCNKIYKKELIDKYKMRFPTDIKYEDIPFVLNYIYHSKKINKVDRSLYNYIIHKESEQTTVDSRIFDIIKSIKMCENIVGNKLILNLKVKTLTTFAIKTRNIKNGKIRNRFIDEVYKELGDFKKCRYLKEISVVKRIIYKNKLLVKIYTFLYHYFN